MAGAGLDYVQDIERLPEGNGSWRVEGAVLAARLRLIWRSDGMAVQLYGLMSTGKVERFRCQLPLYAPQRFGGSFKLPVALGGVEVGYRPAGNATVLLRAPGARSVRVGIEDELEWSADCPGVLTPAPDGPGGERRSHAAISKAMKALPALPGAL